MYQTGPRSPAEEGAPETRGRTIRNWARFYDAVGWLMSFGRLPGIRKVTLELAQSVPGEKVLDVGCGTGTLAIAAKGKVGPTGDVHGIDASPEMIEVARGKAAKRQADVRFEVGLVEDIPFPDGRFDLVLSSLMLHHLPENLKREGLRQINRVLKPGGRLLIVDLAAASNSHIGHLMSVLGHGANRSDPDELAATVRYSGFRQVEVLETKHKGLAFVRGRK